MKELWRVAEEWGGSKQRQEGFRKQDVLLLLSLIFLHSDAFFTSLEAFLGSQYPRRAWIYQEVACSQRPYVVTAVDSMYFPNLQHSVDLWLRHCDYEDDAGRLLLDDCLKRIQQLQWNSGFGVLDEAWSSLRGNQNLSLVRYLQRTGSLGCENKLDRIYSLLGIADGCHDFAVDYTETTCNLFWRAAEHFGHVDGLTLECLQLALSVDGADLRGYPGTFVFTFADLLYEERADPPELSTQHLPEAHLNQDASRHETCSITVFAPWTIGDRTFTINFRMNNSDLMEWHSAMPKLYFEGVEPRPLLLGLRHRHPWEILSINDCYEDRKAFAGKYVRFGVRLARSIVAQLLEPCSTPANGNHKRQLDDLRDLMGGPNETQLEELRQFLITSRESVERLVAHH